MIALAIGLPILGLEIARSGDSTAVIALVIAAVGAWIGSFTRTSLRATRAQLGNRLATLVPERREELAEAHGGKARVILEKSADVVLKGIEKGIELRGPWRSRVLGRVSTPNGADGDLLHEVETPDVCPLLHA